MLLFCKNWIDIFYTLIEQIRVWILRTVPVKSQAYSGEALINCLRDHRYAKNRCFIAHKLRLNTCFCLVLGASLSPSIESPTLTANAQRLSGDLRYEFRLTHRILQNYR